MLHITNSEIEFVPHIQYTKSSDYLSRLGTHPSKAEGRIQDLSVSSHQHDRHLKEHIEYIKGEFQDKI
jgi:hypothetical protein